MNRMKVYWILLVFIFCVYIDCSKFPRNVAVFHGQPSRLNCTAIDPSTIYEETQWTYIKSQNLFMYKISTNLTINAFLKEYFEFADNTTYSLNLKKVDKDTSGLFQCSGLVNANKVDKYHAFVSSMDTEPGCDEQVDSLPDSFPADRKVAYCFTKYAGAYPPTLMINSDGRVEDQFSTSYGEYDGNYHFVGSCALVEKSKNFSCDAVYGAPPVELIEDITYDASSPGLKASCSKTDKNEKAVPSWLKSRCERTLARDYTKRPKNQVARRGSSVVLNCSDINKEEHNKGNWRAVQSEGGSGIELTENFDVKEDLKDIFDFPIPEVFNLRVKDIDKYLTGYYECIGFMNNTITEQYSAFVLSIDKPTCHRISHNSLEPGVKLAFCHTFFSGDWSPYVHFTVDEQSVTSPIFERPSLPLHPDWATAGSCMLINDTEAFNCKVGFDGPPEHALVDVKNVDSSAPDFQEACIHENSQAPAWLVSDCETFLNIPPDTPQTTQVYTVQTKTSTIQTTVPSRSSREAYLNISFLITLLTLINLVTFL